MGAVIIACPTLSPDRLTGAATMASGGLVLMEGARSGSAPHSVRAAATLVFTTTPNLHRVRSGLHGLRLG